MALKKNRTNNTATAKTVPPHCVGNPNFDPSKAFADTENHGKALRALNEDDDFDKAIRTWFGIPDEDEYVYHAVASVTLRQAQRAVEVAREKGLCLWYDGVLGEGVTTPPPSTSDILAYTSLFLPSLSPSSTLKSFSSNARKSSVRALVASHLASKRSSAITPPKSKKPPPNPYLDVWMWSCHVLNWCGPVPDQKLKGHHLLPVLMHHFGCAVPSHEALGIVKILAEGGNGKGKRKRKVVDVGSGNGYWSWMLRQGYGVDTVAVDNGQSEWRVHFLPSETINLPGTDYLASVADHKDIIMMLVYPVVGGATSGTPEGSFTRDLMAAYKGDTVVVVGTQNHNGYTGFRDMTFDEYMDKEQKQNGWIKLVQIPLPSFAGKDEAMYVYQRGEALSTV